MQNRSINLIAYKVLPYLYRPLLRATKRRGMETLARAHFSLFSAGGYVDIPGRARMFIPGNKHFIGYLVGLHEEHIAQVIESRVSCGDACLDVGANIGYFTAQIASRAALGGRVLCFEPDAANFDVLSRNAKIISGATGCLVQPMMAAVSSTEGTLQLMPSEECTGHQVAHVADGDSAGRLVRAVTLDDQCADMTGEVALAKIDVEGHERDVLKGSLNILSRRLVKSWILEVSPGPDAVWIGGILRDAGYSTRVWLDGSWREQPLEDLPYRTDLLSEQIR